MLVGDHLKPAAVAAGVLIENDPRRFGFHNLRHTLLLSLCDQKPTRRRYKPYSVIRTIENCELNIAI
jgi:hypothetical protein